MKILAEKFNVGKEMEITMEIKPRSIDGILMSVQTPKKNLLILEMKNGTMSFSVDLGKGPSASYTPASPYFLCDGQWHKIKGWFNFYLVQIYIYKYLYYL